MIMKIDGNIKSGLNIVKNVFFKLLEKYFTFFVFETILKIFWLNFSEFK